ncbi:MAG: hypothetical protein HYY43_02000 [Deltaproteobacteria bacterium]|nr:hypothetical protein [Deltaproteobacteria bacterium]MBI2974349.1 hypothetical protein [Deltaproteobacteria bacterium]
MGDFKTFTPTGVNPYKYGSAASKPVDKTYTPSSETPTYHYGSGGPLQVRTAPPPAHTPQTPLRQFTPSHSEYARSYYEYGPKSTPAEQREFLQSIKRFGETICALMDNKYDYCK